MIIYTKEYEVISVQDEEIKNIKDDLKEDNPLYLGLHRNNNQYMTSHFVGIVPLNNNIYLHVRPKIEGSPIMMLSEIINSNIRLKYGKNDTYYHIIRKKPISQKYDKKLQDNGDDSLIYLNNGLIFAIINYIGILYNLAKKGLQKGYIKIEENLSSRVRGKILIEKTFKNNFYKSKLHKNYCSFYQYIEDTLENRILKVAFLKGMDYLHKTQIDIGKIPEINYVSSMFENVKTSHIELRDFRNTNVQRINPDYKIAIETAKDILMHLGYDPTYPSNISKNTYIYPYYIDMNELFERYCEVKLKNKEILHLNLKDYEVYAGYDYKNIDTEVGDLRPDFVLVNDKEFIIGDAKYKEYYDDIKSKSERVKQDIQQLSLYGRIKWENIKKAFNIQKNPKNTSCEKLIIFYPQKEEDKCECLKDFNNIYKIGIRIPSLDYKKYKQ